MNAAFDDERLSAYLDGELSPGERGELEKRLAEDAQLRQALEELRALGVAVQGLPRRRLDEGFASEVMRRAEIEMLTGGARPLATKAAAIEPAVRPDAVRRFAVLRPLIWTAAALAVAVLGWNQFSGRRDRDVVRGERTGENAGLTARTADQPFGSPPPADSATPLGADRAALKRLDADSRNAERHSALPAASAPETAAAQGVAGSPTESHAQTRGAGGDSVLADAAPAEAPPAQADSVAGGRHAPDGAAKNRAVAEISGGQQAQGAVDQLALTLTSSDAVVVCEITPEAAHEGLVYELLAAQAIDPAEVSKEPSRGGEERKLAQPSFKGEAGRAASGRPAASTESKDLAKAQKRPRLGEAHATDLLEIEASPQQIAGFLSAMRQRSGAVTAVHELQRANVALADVLDDADGGGGGRNSVADDVTAESMEKATEKLAPKKKVTTLREAPAASAPETPPSASRSETTPPAAKSAPAEESAPEGDLRREPSRRRAARAPQKPAPSAENADTPPVPTRRSDAKSGSRGDARAAAPSGPGTAKAEEVESESRKKQSDEKQGQQSARGVYRKLTIQPEAVKQRGGRREATEREKAMPDAGADRGRLLGEKGADHSREEGLARQKVVLLIQVRPQVAAAAAAAEDDPPPVPAPVAEPAAK